MSYNTPFLFEEENSVIRVLEEQIREKIPVVSKIEYNTLGYTEENNHVIGLGIYKKGLAEIPDAIGDLRFLKILELDENKFSSLPETIGNLQMLEILHIWRNVKNNNISSLSKNIGKLQSLQELNLENNQLTNLPDTMVNLNALKTLQLKGNPLSSLSKGGKNVLDKLGNTIIR